MDKSIALKEKPSEDYLFTTNDGVKIYKGDQYYYISASGKCFENNYALKKYVRTNQVTFSNRELGLEHLKKEKLYSAKEVLEHLNLLYSMKNSTVDTFTDEDDYITDKWFSQFN